MASDNESRNRVHSPCQPRILAAGKRKRRGLGATLLKLSPYLCNILVACIRIRRYTTGGVAIRTLDPPNRTVASCTESTNTNTNTMNLSLGIDLNIDAPACIQTALTMESL